MTQPQLKSAYLEIGHFCFAKCSACDMANQPYVGPTFDEVCLRIQKLYDAGFREFRLTGKEPLSHPEFIDIMRYIDSLSGATTDLTTTLLTAHMERLTAVSTSDKLRVSIHGFSRESYAEFHNVLGFGAVDAALRTLIELRREAPFDIYYTFSKHGVVFNYGLKQAIELISYMSQLKGFNGRIRFFPMHDYGRAWNSVDKSMMEIFADLVHDRFPSSDFAGFRRASMIECRAHETNLYVKYDGSTYPCCMAGGEVGNPLEQSVFLGNLDHNSVAEMQSVPLVELLGVVCQQCTPKYFKNY